MQMQFCSVNMPTLNIKTRILLFVVILKYWHIRQWYFLVTFTTAARYLVSKNKKSFKSFNLALREASVDQSSEL